MNGGSSTPYLACTPCVPLFVHCLIRVEAEGLLDYQRRAGIISIVRWKLRPVMFGVDLGVLDLSIPLVVQDFSRILHELDIADEEIASAWLQHLTHLQGEVGKRDIAGSARSLLSPFDDVLFWEQEARHHPTLCFPKRSKGDRTKLSQRDMDGFFG